MKHLLSIFIFLLLCISCSSESAEQSEVQPIDTSMVICNTLNQCSKIYSTEWNVHKIVHFNDTITTFLGIRFKSIGERKLVVPIDATVKSYVDMSAVSEQNVHIDPSGIITVVLPNPQIEMTASRIDWDAAKTYVSFYRNSFTEKEKADLLYQGEKSIRQEIKNLKLDAMARHTATRAVTPLIKQLGFSEHKIKILFEEDLKSGM